MVGWLGVWRSRPVIIRSPLPVRVAVRRLEAARASRGMWLSAGSSSGQRGRRIVVGRVAEDEVRLVARGLTRNSWRPVLRARFVAVPGGCELVGSLRCSALALAFTAVWLAMDGLFILLGVAVFVAAMLSGGWSSASGPLALTGAAVGMGVFAVGLVALAGWLGSRDEQFLRA